MNGSSSVRGLRGLVDPFITSADQRGAGVAGASIRQQELLAAAWSEEGAESLWAVEDGPGVAARVVVDWTGAMDDDNSDDGPWVVDSENVDEEVAARVRALACNLFMVVIGTGDPVRSSLVSFFVPAELLWPRPFSLPNNSLTKVVKMVMESS